ncbi:hypothetical protein RMR10_011945 [Agrobacterium rosae]|uniref:hypothetical protein n=1 Tax=Agrobacterium rosae TaxID=1972867 RepID=UPI002A108CD5|nr:hypothetical protein [Agrobacterium rosae]MDX8313340.1 hypothetical protein [Agrobacterium rosae]
MKEDPSLLFDQQVAIAREQNRTANGRLFNVLMFAIVLFIAFKIDTGALWLAFFPPLSVGAGYISDSADRRFNIPAVSVVAAIVPLVSIFYII